MMEQSIVLYFISKEAIIVPVVRTAMVEVIGSARDTSNLKVNIIKDFHPAIRREALMGLAKIAGLEVKQFHPEQYTSETIDKIYTLRVGEIYSNHVTIIPMNEKPERNIPDQLIASAILKKYLDMRTNAYDQTLEYCTQHPEDLIEDKERVVK